MLTHTAAKTLVFNNEGKLLLLVRSDDDPYRPGGYDLPGGQVDDGEEPVAGAAREADEETGLKLVQSDLRLVFASVDTNYRSEFKQDVNLVWLGFVAALPANSEVHLSHEHKGYDWVSVDRALELADSKTHRNFLRHLKDNQVATELWQV